MSNFLAFDLGASSGRGIVGKLNNGKLELHEVHRFPNAPLEKDGSFLWDFPSLCNELEIGLQKALEFEPNLDGIGIDTWGVDYVLYDKDTKEVKRLPYNYRDPRTVASKKAVLDKITEKYFYETSGVQPLEFDTIFQLAAHQAEFPEELVNAQFLPIPDALAFALGGDFTAEVTHASTSGLVSPETRDWNWELIDKANLPRDIFPQIVPACSKGGFLSSALQKKFNCKAIPIYKIGSHDTASAVAAVPAPVDGNWAYISAGTWALLGAELNSAFKTMEAAAIGFSNELGIADKVRFLTNISGSWLFQETRRVWNENRTEKLSFGDMEQMAIASSQCKYMVNPNDPVFITPGDMPSRIRQFCQKTNQGDNLSDAQVVRAIYDSLAMYFNKRLTGLEEMLNVKYNTLNIVGGGTKDKLLMQLASNAINKTVIAGPVEATAIGNLLGQAIAAGAVDSLASAREIVRTSFDVAVYEPQADSAAIYAATVEKFNAIL